MGPRKHVLDGGVHWRNLANTIGPSMCGGDAASLSNYFDHLLLLLLLLLLLESPSRGRTDHFSNIVAEREFSTGCYLFTVSNSGLLSVQRLLPSPTHS